MADANIKVDPKQLKTFSDTIEANYKNMYALLTESKTAVKNLKSTWTGSGSAEFYKRFDEIIEKCSITLNIVNDYSYILSEASQIYSANEQKISNSAGKLKINLK